MGTTTANNFFVIPIPLGSLSNIPSYQRLLYSSESSNNIIDNNIMTPLPPYPYPQQQEKNNNKVNLIEEC